MSDHEQLLGRNYYDMLGVSHTAGEREIKDAETALRKHHEARAKQGDRQANDMLVALNEAYEMLTVDHKRNEYDRHPDVIARGFVDVAYSPEIGRVERLREIARCFGGDDPVREATYLDCDISLFLLTQHSLLGDEG